MPAAANDMYRASSKSRIIFSRIPKKFGSLSRMREDIHTIKPLGLGIIVMAGLIFCYAGVFKALVDQWWSNNMYSYGFLIPVISLYLVWVRREKLQKTRPFPNYAYGVPLLFAGLSMLVAGQAGGIVSLQELSFIIVLASVVLLLLGKNFMRVLWLPITYLLFMIPIWEVVVDGLHLPFQILSADLGVKIMQTAGIPVYRQGIYIELPHITLEVARVCSGVNFLIAVIALGIPLAYLYLKGWRRRIALVGSAIVIAILSNGLRVALIGTLSYYGISSDLHGPFHVLQGLFVSFVGYLVLFGGLWILSKRPYPISHSSESEPKNLEDQEISGQKGILYPAVMLVSLFILLGTYVNLYKPSPVSLKMDLNLFPLQIGEWQGRNTPSSIDIYQELEADHKLSRVYQTDSDRTVHLYIGYFESQEQAKELIDYRTDELLRQASKIKVRLNPHGSVEINKLIQIDGEENRLVLFWYDLNGRIVGDKYMAKLCTIWNALAKGRTNGAVIMITTRLKNRKDLTTGLTEAENFAKKISPILGNYLPQA